MSEFIADNWPVFVILPIIAGLMIWTVWGVTDTGRQETVKVLGNTEGECIAEIDGKRVQVGDCLFVPGETVEVKVNNFGRWVTVEDDKA